MSEKYLNKYRIPSARLQNWDYGANGAYFITICTANRVQYFGKIENCQMQLNQLGQLAEQYWSLTQLAAISIK
jgi:putative transposase